MMLQSRLASNSVWIMTKIKQVYVTFMRPWSNGCNSDIMFRDRSSTFTDLSIYIRDSEYLGILNNKYWITAPYQAIFFTLDMKQWWNQLRDKITVAQIFTQHSFVLKDMGIAGFTNWAWLDQMACCVAT